MNSNVTAASVVNAPKKATGENYLLLLKAIHTHLRPKSYLEIGSENGISLSVSECATLAVDPAFQIKRDVITKKPSFHAYQMPSDDFFRRVDPTVVLGDKIDFAFLDGMHLYEFLLRDFLSAEIFKHGLICRADDRGDPVIQLSPPLVADSEEFEIIDRVLRQVLTEAWDRIVRH